jgi:hypothetical protein
MHISQFIPVYLFNSSLSLRAKTCTLTYRVPEQEIRKGYTFGGVAGKIPALKKNGKYAFLT